MDKKLFQRFYCIVLMTVMMIALTAATAFGAPRDVQAHWSGAAVNTLLEYGILSESPDGRYKPDRPMSRGEASALIATFVEVTCPELITGGGISFQDVQPGSIDANHLNLLYSLDITKGYPDGTFRPQELLSRQAFASMIYKLKLVLADKGNETVTGIEGSTDRENGTVAGNEGAADEPAVGFSDMQDSYAHDAVYALTADGVLHGYPDGTFRPEETITRGEAAAVIFSLSELPPVELDNELPDFRVIEVPYISQIEPYQAWVGCEGTSLLMGLKSKGYAQDINLKQFLDDMPKDACDPEKGFAGSPYVPDKQKKIRTTIYPAKLAEYASLYGTVSDFSGSSVEELQAEVLFGNPVVAYVTMNWEPPFYRNYMIDEAPRRMLSNNHVVLVCGYDRKTGMYYISDPYNRANPQKEYKYWIEGGVFEPLYNERKHAVVVE